MKKRKEKENINKEPFNNLYIIVITSLLIIKPTNTTTSHCSQSLGTFWKRKVYVFALQISYLSQSGQEL